MEQFDDSPEMGQEFDDTPPEQQDQAPQLVRVRFNGQTYMVPEDVADAWHAREESFNRKLGEQSDELGYLRRQTGQRQQADPQAGQERSFWEDPEGFIETRFQRQDALIQQRQSFAEAEKAYWGAFYRTYPHLRTKQATVRGVMSQIVESIKHLPPEESQARIAAQAERELGLNEDQGNRTRLPNKQVASVGGSNDRPQRRQAEPEADDETYSGMDALKARQRAKAKARLSF